MFVVAQVFSFPKLLVAEAGVQVAGAPLLSKVWSLLTSFRLVIKRFRSKCLPELSGRYEIIIIIMLFDRDILAAGEFFPFSGMGLRHWIPH